MLTAQFTAKRFCMDALEGEVFDGFTDGSDWNGWACPYFTKEIAEAVLIASRKNGYNYAYDQEQDVFVVKAEHEPDNYESEVFEGEKLKFGDEEITVYGIGAYSWIWEVCE